MPSRHGSRGPSAKQTSTTQNSGIKKASKAQKSTEQQIYIVSRQMATEHGEFHEVRDTYKSLAAANAAARADLLSEWDADYFETYEVEEIGGMVHVIATCPEGEGMEVIVEKAELKKGGGDRKGKVESKGEAKGEAKGKAIEAPPREITMYHVMREDIDYRNDYNGGLHGTGIHASYLSLEKANEAARKILAEEQDNGSFEEYEEELSNGMVTITVTYVEGEVMNVSVVKGKLDTTGWVMGELPSSPEDNESEDESEDGSQDESQNESDEESGEESE